MARTFMSRSAARRGSNTNATTSQCSISSRPTTMVFCSSAICCTDAQLGSHFRAFGQVQSSLEDFRNGGPRPTDRDDFDLHQAFFDASTTWHDENAVTLRAGRQELAYGSQRLISVRDSPNNRLAFDAVRVR